MSPNELAQAARVLRQAAEDHQFIRPLSQQYPALDAASAYSIQQINTEDRLQQGRRIVGRKIGLTSQAVQKQLGVSQPDFGVLFDDMGYGDSEEIPWRRLHQPKIEAEVAFVLGKDLAVASPSLVDVINAVDYALPALEVVGSRIANWKIGIGDTIADNASSSAYVLGTTPRRLSEFDVRLCGMELQRHSEPVSVGAGLACLGNPLNAVVWLARTMERLGTPLRAGDLILSGALGPMVAVEQGDVFQARINGLGSVRAIFQTEHNEASHEPQP